MTEPLAVRHKGAIPDRMERPALAGLGIGSASLTERRYTRPIRAAAFNLALYCLSITSIANAGVWTPISWVDDSSLSFITSATVSHAGDFGSAATINAFTFETIGIAGGTGTFSSPYAGSNFTVGLPAGTFSYNTFAVDQSAGAGDKMIRYAYQTGANTSFTMTVTSNTQGFSLHHYGFVNIRDAAAQDVDATDYDVWAEVHDLAGGSDDDDDGDALTNSEEYAFGLLPDSPSSCNPMLTPLDQSTGKFLYARREAALTGNEYTTWTSTDLSLWTEDKGATQEVIDLWKGIETVEATLSSTLLDKPSLFVKVRADFPPP